MKRLFLTLLSVLVLSGVGFSQGQSAEITASATLISALNVENVSDLVFGEISGDWDNATVPLTDTDNRGLVKISSTIGYPLITVTMDFPTHLTLVGTTDGNNELDVDFIWGVTDEDDETIETEYDETVTSADVNLASDGTDRTVYIPVGGTVKPKSNEDNDEDNNVAGTYEGTITVSAEYN